MDRNILEFATLLRKAGVKVSHSEVADSLQALSLAGLEKGVFYDSLAVTMVKDWSDFNIFDKIFNYYFDPEFFGHREEALKRWPKLMLPLQGESGCSGSDPVSGKGRSQDSEHDAGTDRGRSTGFGQGQGLATAAIDDFMQVVKIGCHEDMADIVKKGVKSLGAIREEDLRDMKAAVRQVKVFLEWNMGVYRLEREACEVDESVSLKWQERLTEMEEMLYRELEKAIINQLGQEALDTILFRENLNEIDFYSISAPQTAEIKKKISKLAHKLATRLSFRRRRAKHGKIDLPKTIRKSMATGGVPIKPAFRDRYPTRPEIVILCDISGSVRIFSEFMLQLVYSIQNRFVHVRSFVFVDTPDEVTQYMHNREIEDGIRDIYNKARFSKTAFSDYGQMFIEFCENYLAVLNKKTTLIVIGDARNNYHRAHTDYYQKMCEEVKKVIWLNPEPSENWDNEDSIMSVYGPFCHQVFECRNLQQLDRVARKII